ncbi:MAG: helix-turn-helix transcriptional regulator [Clostridiales bacterium]|nr:helix-turn-helix transcriptional regulator [Clostridiales bacterium]
MAKIINQDISIGSNLKVLRQKAGLSQEAAAAKLQIMGFTMSREVISQMELGKHNIRISVLLALRDIYNVQIQDFFDGL